MLPFVPDHKDVARRLVNSIFMDAERVGTNVRGYRAERMDAERIGAVHDAVFRLCPTGGEDIDSIWQRCVTAINDQNRNIERRLKKLLQ